MKKLAIITTHPIQYNAPWFQLLAKRKKIEIKVYYTWSQVEDEEKFDPGFGKVVEWDIPLLDGYDYTFVENVSREPGSKSFRGIDNPSLIREIEDWGADAVLVFGWNFKSHKKAMAYFHGKIPVLFRGDSTTLDTHGFIKDFLRFLYLNKVYKNVDVALYAGIENKKYFLKAGLKEGQLVNAPHAVDNQRFNDHSSIEVAGWPQIDKKKVIFLFAGKLEPKKNPELLLEAFVAGNVKDAHLVIVGNGPLEESLKNRFHSDLNITFLPFQNQAAMPAVYHLSDVFILPSQGPGETWGLAVNEAMAAGKPVLVSDKCGCAKDLVEDGVTGYVFKSGDTANLSEKLRMMADDKTVLKNMGKSAFERIQHYSFENIVKAVEDVMMRGCG